MFSWSVLFHNKVIRNIHEGFSEALIRLKMLSYGNCVFLNFSLQLTLTGSNFVEVSYSPDDFVIN